MSKPESLYSVLDKWREDKTVPLEKTLRDYIHKHLRERSGLLCDDWYVDDLLQHLATYPMLGSVWFKERRVKMQMALPDSNSVLDVYIEITDEMNADGVHDTEISLYLEENGTGTSVCLGGADMANVNWLAVMSVLDEYRSHAQSVSGV